ALAVGGEDQMIGTAYIDDEISPRWAEAYSQIPVLAPQYPDRETVLEQRPDLVGASYASAFDDKELGDREDRKSTSLNSSHVSIFFSYATLFRSCARRRRRGPDDRHRLHRRRDQPALGRGLQPDPGARPAVPGPRDRARTAPRPGRRLVCQRLRRQGAGRPG